MKKQTIQGSIYIYIIKLQRRGGGAGLSLYFCTLQGHPAKMEMELKSSPLKLFPSLSPRYEQCISTGRKGPFSSLFKGTMLGVEVTYVGLSKMYGEHFVS